ncbi:AAA family ATPase [Williamsia muralis]|uniref:AAA family ATPase n=1 Tax=Williamsia marianensis TaxID=85044 RepID=UPI0016713646|nr:AAA family ATPase [Williamsia marianensis]
MIIWFNGCPGAGKTSAAEVLHGLTGVHTINLEKIGRMLQRFTGVDDYQYSAIWQTIARRAPVSMARLFGHVVVDMTLLDPGVRLRTIDVIKDADEKLVEIFLHADRENLSSRIRDRGGVSVDWCLSNLERFMAYGIPACAEIVLVTDDLELKDIRTVVADACTPLLSRSGSANLAIRHSSLQESIGGLSG